ncbi:MAG: ABC transporter ATP-binding protein [Bryobacteraceae bacterium]|nr:ABC transporter ATP-binding protein [Bryobacteraceae bacterium]
MSRAPSVTAGEALAEVREVSKTYRTGGQEYQALRGVSLSLEAGEFSMLAGPSGCGKTTLLSILGGVLRPSSGVVTVLGNDLVSASESRLEDYRLSTVGFIFQGHNLLACLTAEDNVAVLLELRGSSRTAARQRAREILSRVRLSGKEHKLPRDLSVGERQRVAVARALAGDPQLILADEPTASLDAANGTSVMTVLRELAKNEGKTVLTVTHDNRIFHLADRVLHMEDGKLLGEEEGR